MSQLQIRPATINDSELILEFIIKLAKLEEFSFEISVTLQDIQNNLFGRAPVAKSLLIYFEEKPIGFAVYYFTFSTCLGRKGLHLEDLYMEPEHHGNGFGKQVMQYLAGIALQSDCARFEWRALNNNVKAIDFYTKRGAKKLDELSVFRLDSDGIDRILES